MKFKKNIIFILICILGCILLVAGCGSGESKIELEAKSAGDMENKFDSKNVTVTVIDSAGRSVELPQPLEKIATLNGNVIEAMHILKVQDKVIGVSESIKNNPYFEMQDKDVVAKGFQPNYEMIVELKPQVFISYNSYGPAEETIEKLESAGIKVLLMDLHKPETYDHDLLKFSKIFGKEKEADVFLKWKAEQLTVLGKVKEIKPEQRVSVLGMTTSGLQSEKWTAAANDTAVHQAIELAGGVNVARDLSGYANISPEWILEQNPMTLVIADYTGNLVGFNVKDLATSEDYIQQTIKNSKVLGEIDAVQLNRVYIMPNGMLGGDKSYLGAQYLAKWFYPDLFEDIDPDKVLQEYFETWLDVPFLGKWAYPSVAE